MLAALDEISRETLGRFAIRTSVVGIAAFAVPFVLGVGSMERGFGNLALCLTAASCIAMFAAAKRGERPGVGSLNGWDESMAFTGLATLFRLLLRLHA